MTSRSQSVGFGFVPSESEHHFLVMVPSQTHEPIYILAEQPQNFLPRPCSQTVPFRETGCLDHEPTQQEAAAAK